MKKEVVLKLNKKAYEIAKNFSKVNREFNVNNETFEVSKIEPLSESTGVVLLKKSSGKYAVAFCYYINMSGGVWQYFIPTYDHIFGMESVRELLALVEKTNFKKN
jgi:predicted mannosyl-3-phosphoglycerate phosphatase (HAD superfamily)